MAIRYNKLWKKLIDENMMKVDLRDQAGITTNALAKLGKGYTICAKEEYMDF
ncbi:MAG: helix-turn-helix domain-containing protein [Roseburia sp.]